MDPDILLCLLICFRKEGGVLVCIFGIPWDVHYSYRGPSQINPPAHAQYKGTNYSF